MSFLQCKLSNAYYIKIKYLNVASVAVNKKPQIQLKRLLLLLWSLMLRLCCLKTMKIKTHKQQQQSDL